MAKKRPDPGGGDLDEYDRRLLELEREMEAEEKAQAMAAAEQELEEDELDEDEEPPEEADEDPDEVVGSRPETRASRSGSGALDEIAAESLSGKGSVGEAAVTVVKRRLPALPSREKARNTALALAGGGAVLWLSWGIVAPILAWVWFGMKVALLGGVAYGAYWLYNRLPEEDDPEEADED